MKKTNVSATSAKESKKANNANETKKEVYTIENLKTDFLACNSDLLELSKKLGCKYAAAHKNFDGTAKPGARTRIQLTVDGVTSTFDKVKLQELTGTYNPKATPKTGERCKDPEQLRIKAQQLRDKANELEQQANEIEAANAAKAASVAKINEAAKGLKVDGLTVEEQKQLLKVLKMQLANA